MYHLFDSERVLSEVKNTEFSRHNDFAKLLLLYIEDFFNLEPDSLALDVRGKVKASIEVLRLLSKKELHLFYIVFPPGEEGEKIFSILECVGRLRFTQCSFLVGRIELKKPKVSFFDCEFISNYDVLDMNLRKDKAYDDCLYQRCVFRGNVSCGSDERKERLIIRHSLFSDCKFFGRVRFENAELQGYFVDGDPRYPSSLSRLKVENCIFQNGFYINSQKMAYAYLTSCVFQGKFEFKQNSVDRLIFDNCNFKKISDFYASSIRRFTLRKSIFDTFVGFEECHFGVLPGPRRRSITPEIGIGLACFIYVTFLEFASFRGARFNEGLDLEKINTIEQPNFHRVFVSFAETPRETFRMIKHALDSHGAHIEANKFFALEMKRRKHEFLRSRFTADRLIYAINHRASDFGQSYLLPVMWIFVFALSFYALCKGQQSNMLYKIYPPANEFIAAFTEVLNEIASSVIPFKQFLRTGMEFISLIFYVVFAVLIWQVIVALKRMIRR